MDSSWGHSRSHNQSVNPSTAGKVPQSQAFFDLSDLAGPAGQVWYMPLAFLALVSAMLQVSLFNHYYVRYRQAAGGDQTSQVSEAEPAGYAWDNPVWLGPLYLAYRVIYGWQDALIARLDQ